MIVEIFDRRGTVRARVPLRGFPASIGRGYGNDVILDDRFVSPVHARLVRDGTGGLVLEDAGSVNGLSLEQGGPRHTRIPVRSGTRVRVGRTLIRFVEAEQPVEPTLVDTPRSGSPRSLTGSQGRMLAICLAAFGVLALSAYLDSGERTSTAQLTSHTLIILLAAAIWAGAWAFASRVTTHRFRFLEHFTMTVAVIAGFVLLAALTEYLEFLFPAASLTALLGAATGFGLGTALLAGHLARVASLEPLRRWLTAAVAAGSLVGLIELSSFANDSPELTPTETDAPLKPIGERWIPTISTAEYLKRVDGLKADVDSLAEE